MLSEWGTWQPTVWEQWGMDPALLAILEKNQADIAAIIADIGIAAFIKMLPHLVRIGETYAAAKAGKK